MSVVGNNILVFLFLFAALHILVQGMQEESFLFFWHFNPMQLIKSLASLHIKITYSCHFQQKYWCMCAHKVCTCVHIVCVHVGIVCKVCAFDLSDCSVSC